ncbi:hypothetical protein TWF281_001413 [Arthrobotrys megalospora]
MKTSGDRGGADGSLEPLSSRRVLEGGVVKQQKSSNTKQKLAKALRRKGILEVCDQPEESPLSSLDPFDGLPVSPTKDPDNLLEVDGMPVDVFLSKTVTPEPNGSLNQFDDTARDCDSGKVDDSGTNVDTKASGFLAINDQVGTGNIANINEAAGISVAPSDESTFTSLSVWSGDVGNQPTSSNEVKSHFIDTLYSSMVNSPQFPNLNSQAERRTGYIYDQYGSPICHVQDLNVDEMFPPRSDYDAVAVGTSVRGHSEDVTMSNGTAPHEVFPILPRSPPYFIERPLELSSTEGASDTGESDTSSGY